VRIVSGTHKRRLINAPKNLRVRPTTDFAKESLFNILKNHLKFDHLREVLDLFAGTGNISYEFASRGSENITAVDMNFKSTKFIKNTAGELGFDIHVVKANVFSFLEYCKKTYDLIFADPPYDMSRIEMIPDIIFEKGLLNKAGWLIVEHSKDISFNEHPNFFEHRKYGKVNFTFFRNNL